MESPLQVVVLLGPPGSGKSAVGAALADLGLRWTDREHELLEHWGSLEAFLANKTEALRALHDELRASIDPGCAPLVIESTGLSEREFIDGIERSFPTLLVRLDVGSETAARRIGGREAGRHLDTDPARQEAVWRAFEELVKPRRVDLVIDTELSDPAATAQAIVVALSASPSRSAPG